MDFSLLNKVPIDKEIYILQIFNELTEIMGNEGYIHANSIIVGDNSILSISTFRQPGESGEKDSACDRLFSTRVISTGLINQMSVSEAPEAAIQDIEPHAGFCLASADGESQRRSLNCPPQPMSESHNQVRRPKKAGDLPGKYPNWQIAANTAIVGF